MSEKIDLLNFISEAPLYKKHETGISLINPGYFNNQGVEFYCSIEKKIIIHLMEYQPNNFSDARLSPSMIGPFVSKSSEGKISFTPQYKCICSSCKEHCVDLLLSIQSLESIAKDTKYEVRKIGQLPPIEIKPSKLAIDHFDEENLQLYKKALMNLNYNYGIGAFAYFRRIAEKEIRNLLTEFGGSDTIDESRISELIDESFKYLPESLKSLGDNPLKLIYAQLSDGLHGLTDEQCLSKAQSINTLLIFIIKNLNIEKNDKADVVKAIKNLKD